MQLPLSYVCQQPDQLENTVTVDCGNPSNSKYNLKEITILLN